MRLLLSLFLLFYASISFAVTDRELFDRIGRNYDVNPYLLEAIAKAESRKNPYALNINGESAYCTSEKEAIRAINYVSNRPWLVILPKGGKKLLGVLGKGNCALNGVKKKKKYDRAWFKTRNDAINFIKKYSLNTKPVKKNIQSTDFGKMQINWTWHKNRIPNAKLLFDPVYNISYAAIYLKELINKHGVYTAIGKYHSKHNKRRQEKYRERVLDHFYKIKLKREAWAKK